MYQSFPQKIYNEQSNAMPIPKENAVFKKDDKCCDKHKNKGILGIFDGLDIDDIILIGLIIILLTEGNDEWLLIGLLAFMLLN